MNVLFVGGDQRQLEMIRIFKEKKANIHLLGFHQLMQSFVEARKVSLKELNINIYDVIILPVNGVSDEGKVRTLFSNEDFILPLNFFSNTKENVKIFTGIKTKRLEEMLEFANRDAYILMERDDVAIYNSIPTVEGVIMMLVENTDYTIFGSNIYVFGFGRVGETLARTLKNLGANVTVVVRSKKNYARVKELKMNPLYIEKVKAKISDANIIINIVPALVITRDILDEVNVNTFILDISSKPGGVDFEYAKKRGLKADLVLGIPGLVAPKTAGKILAEAILEIISEGSDESV